jgi:hypothetical protein
MPQQVMFCPMIHPQNRLRSSVVPLHAKKYTIPRVTEAGGGVPQMPSGDFTLFDPGEQGMMGGTSDLKERLQAGVVYHQDDTQLKTKENDSTTISDSTKPVSNQSSSNLLKRKVNNLGVPMPIPSSVATYHQGNSMITSTAEEKEAFDDADVTDVQDAPGSVESAYVAAVEEIDTEQMNSMITSIAEEKEASDDADVTNVQDAPGSVESAYVAAVEEIDTEQMLDSDPPLLMEDEMQAAIREKSRPVTTTQVWEKQENWWDEASLGRSMFGRDDF